jgi:4-hydroxy-4-methyl-2-oxoglutarate aldolase
VYESPTSRANDFSPVATGLRSLGTALVCDVLDGLGCRVSFLGPRVERVWPSEPVAGPAFTMTCRPASEVPGEPYGVLFRALADRRDGSILVVQAGDEVSGVWGELLSTAAIARGLVGAVTDGLTRDVGGIAAAGFPVYATGTSPLDSAGRQDFAAFGGPVTIGGVAIETGDWIVADDLGVARIPAEHVQRVVELGTIKMAGESTVRQELAAGEDLGTVFRRHGIL